MALSRKDILSLGTVSLAEAKLAVSILDGQLATQGNWLEGMVLRGDTESAIRLANERESTRNVRAMFAHSIALVEGY